MSARVDSTELTRPRSVGGLVRTTLVLYRAQPVLFLALALIVVGPFELIVLAVTGVPPLGQGHAKPATAFVLVLLDFALVGPFVSALHARAVAELAEGRTPRLREVAVAGARTLPVVAAAQIIAGIGIGLGAVLFIIPGILLAIRWAVVAQVAAIEGSDWPGALRRSGRLTSGSYVHVFGLLVLTGLFNYAISAAATAAAGTHRSAGAVVLGIAVDTLTRSVTALATAVLYFELLGRSNVAQRGETTGRPEDPRDSLS